jgi:hypothetical protein
MSARTTNQEDMGDGTEGEKVGAIGSLTRFSANSEYISNTL